MHDHLLLHVLQRAHDLQSVRLNLQLVQLFSVVQTLSKGLVWTQLQHNINVVVIFEVALKLANALVFYASVDFELGHQLRFVTRIIQGQFFYHFQSGLMLGLYILNLVASCESPLAKLLHLPILNDRVFARSLILDDLLYNVCGSFGLRTSLLHLKQQIIFYSY
jgi:hypothetical protein